MATSARWDVHTKHREFTSKDEKDLPASAFALPKQRKEPLIDEPHARNASRR